VETVEHIIQRPETQSHEIPLFLQHGAWHGAWCWNQFLDYFTSLGYKVHTISLPGHGNSSMNKGHIDKYSFQDYVDCMAAEITRVSPTPVVMGHSLGGSIVQKYLETHSVPGAVLLASVPVTGMLRMTLRLLWRHPWQTLKTGLLMNAYAWVETPELAAAHFLSSDTAIDVHEFHARLVPESFCVGLRLTLSPSLHPEKVRSPVLVLAAENDALFSVAEERRTAEALNAKLVVFPGQAHNLMMEPAWKQVADTIDAWVTNELGLP
jgi:pimeloyl-ACP methyl ester carboxylesterase